MSNEKKLYSYLVYEVEKCDDYKYIYSIVA